MPILNKKEPQPAEAEEKVRSLKAKLIYAVIAGAVAGVLIIASPWWLPATKNLFWDRGTWVIEWFLGDTERGEDFRRWRYTYLEGQVAVPEIKFNKLEVSGSKVSIRILADPADTWLRRVELRGVQQQVLALDVVQRFQTTLELPDGKYSIYVEAENCDPVGSRRIRREISPVVCQADYAEGTFIVDTRPVVPLAVSAVFDGRETVYLRGGVQDLSGLRTAKVRSAVVDSEDHRSFELNVPLSVANRELRKQGTISVVLIDQRGVEALEEVELSGPPNNGWARFKDDARNGEGRRTAPILEVRPLWEDPESGVMGFWGYPPEQTWARFEKGQETGAFGTDPEWYRWSRLGAKVGFGLGIFLTLLLLWWLFRPREDGEEEGEWEEEEWVDEEGEEVG